VLRRHLGGQVFRRRDPAGAHLRADAARLDHVDQPHLYWMMCSVPAGDPAEAMVADAGESA
jgi:hypothetical protein